MRILLTGGSGVLGAVVAHELAPRSDLTCLTRRRRLDRVDVRQVKGDLTVPGMGLAARELRDLVAQTDVVVHCGAMTSFDTDAAASRGVNVDGTKRVLDLAERAGARLVHVSTAFIARVDEFADDGPTDLRSPLSYLRSKVEAESLVLGSGLDPLVIRPSVLMGDSRSGVIQKFQGWHTMSGAVITGRTPFLPAGGDTLVDLVPVDDVARVIAGLVLAGAEPGAWWLTAGDQACSLQRSLEICLQIAAEHGLAPAPPRLLPREMVERLVMPAFAAGAPPQLRRQMLEGIELMRLFGSEHRFPSRWPAGLARRASTTAELEDCARVSLRYWCEKQGLGIDQDVETDVA